MKSNYLLIYLLLVFLNVSGQSNYQFLKGIVFDLSDSVMEVGGFQSAEIQFAWCGFDSLQIKDDSCVEEFYFDREKTELQTKDFVIIDTTNLFFSLVGNSDNQLQVKSIITESDTSVIVNVNSSSEGEPSECLFIGFYKVKDNNLFNYTNSILAPLDYLSDNFSKPTIDSLSKYYTNLGNLNSYQYNVSKSDTITISFNLYQFYCCDLGLFYIDPNYLEADFFHREYLLHRSRLKPIGIIRKKRKSKTAIFMLKSD